MIYSNVQNSRSAHFDPKYVPASGAYDKGLFSLETWTCETMRAFSSFGDYDFGKQCIGERASRSLLILVSLFSLATAGSVAWDIKMTQLLIRPESQNKAEWGDEEEMH